MASFPRRLARHLLPQTLVSRVYALYGACLLLFVGVALGLFYRYLLTQEIEDAQALAETLAHVMHRTVTDSAVIGDYDTIKGTLERSVQNSKFSAASFIDVAGPIIRAQNPVKAPKAPPEWVKGLIGSRLYDVNLPVEVGGRDYGILRLSFDANLVAADLWRLTQYTLALAMFGILSGLYVVRLPLRKWLGTLDRVQAFEQALRAGVIDPGKALQGEVPAELRTTFDVLSRAARSLRSQLEEVKLFQAVIDNSAFGVTIADARTPDLPLVYVNEAFLALTGYQKSEVLGKNCRFLRGPDTDPMATAAISDAIARKGPVSQELVNHRKDGTTFWNRLSLFPIFDRAGALTHYVGYQWDISDQRRAAEIQSNLERELRDAQSMQALGKLVAGAAHEINNPMGIALTAVSHARLQIGELRHALAKTPGSSALGDLVDEQSEAIELTQSNLQRGIELVRSLKEVAANQTAAQWRTVPVRSTIETIITTLRPTLRRAGCALAFSCRAEGSMRTEPGAVAQILQNLILNAVTHGFEGVSGERNIEVEIDREGAAIVTKVRDNGRGIAPDLMDTIFLPFVTSRRNAGGTGLGLHIARELATRKLQGSLSLTSGAPGKTEFVLRLPETVSEEHETRHPEAHSHV